MVLSYTLLQGSQIHDTRSKYRAMPSVYPSAIQLLYKANSATSYSLKLPVSKLEPCHGKSEELSRVIRAECVRGCCTTSNLRVDGDTPGIWNLSGR